MPKYQGQEVKILEATTGWYAIELPDGTRKSVRRKELEQDPQVNLNAKENTVSTEQAVTDVEVKKSRKSKPKAEKKIKAKAKKPAKKVKKAANGEVLTMAEALAAHRDNYVKGARSMHCGDDVSMALDGLDPAQKVRVANIVSQGTERPVKVSEWDNLNGGQRAMNAANRIRGLLNGEHITLTDINKAVKQVA